MNIIKEINNFINKNQCKYNFISKYEKNLREKKKLTTSHYVGYDPEDDF